MQLFWPFADGEMEERKEKAGRTETKIAFNDLSLKLYSTISDPVAREENVNIA